jgi:hypothetical protein
VVDGLRKEVILTMYLEEMILNGQYD